MPTIDFFNSENMMLFWDYVKMLLMGVQPAILISVAVVAVGLILGIVVKAWRKSSDDQLKDNDDDYEIRHY